MSERPKSMDEFAAGMRRAAFHASGHGASAESEAAIAYVAEQFEFVEVYEHPDRDSWCRIGAGLQVHSRSERASALISKPAREPEPPDAVREAAEGALEILSLWLDRPLGPTAEAIKIARAELRAALKAE